MRTNKEFIDHVTDYLLKQDPTVVAKTCASTMLDMVKMWNFQSLESNERKRLLNRVEKNIKSLNEFLNDPKMSETKLKNISDEI